MARDYDDSPAIPLDELLEEVRAVSPPGSAEGFETLALISGMDEHCTFHRAGTQHPSWRVRRRENQRRCSYIHARQGFVSVEFYLLSDSEMSELAPDANWTLFGEQRGWPIVRIFGTHDAEQVIEAMAENIERASQQSQESLATSLPPERAPRYWVEKTKVKGEVAREDGPDALGHALWSPQKGKRGVDIYGAMRAVHPGDVILHLTENRAFAGVSRVAARADDSFICPEGSAWAGRPGYRVQLESFQPLNPSLHRADWLDGPEAAREIAAIIRSAPTLGKMFLAEGNGSWSLGQGKYLSETNDAMVSYLDRVYHSVHGKHLPLEFEPSTASPTVPTWCIWADRHGRANFETGMAGNIWGWKEAPFPTSASGISEGDYLFFVFNAEQADPKIVGWPRAWTPDRPVRVEKAVLARATSSVYLDSAPVWPDEAYPHRLNFEPVATWDDMPLDQDSVSPHVIEALRLSVCDRTRPKAVHGWDPRTLPLESATRQQEPPRPAMPTPTPKKVRVTSPLTLDGAMAAVAEAGILISPEVVANIIAAIHAKQHVVLTGAPGTGKSTIAMAIAAYAERQGWSNGYAFTTATADWTTFDTIGGLRPTKTAMLEYSPGQFVQSLQDERWLIIDELNRAQLDRAFGPLFSVLAGQSVELPFELGGEQLVIGEGGTLPVPPHWRIIGTMNTLDKSLLFELSYAFMRRFTFIDIPSPSTDDLFGLMREKSGSYADAFTAISDLHPLTAHMEIGPAIFLSAIEFAVERERLQASGPQRLTLSAFESFILPQMEGLDAVKVSSIFDYVVSRVRPEDRAGLRDRIESVLGVAVGDELAPTPTADSLN